MKAIPVALAATILAVALALPPAALHAQDTDGDSIQDELSILTRILESTLDDAVDPSAHRIMGNVAMLGSVFDRRISAEYVPTVGAMITIPLRFPLRPSDKEPSAEPAQVEEEDLWEHFSEKGTKVAPEPAPVPVVDAIEQIQINGIINESDVREIKARVREQGRARTEYDRAVSRIQLSIPSFGGAGNSEPYDPIKVSNLTRAVLETVGRYGKRLSALPDSERILIILEAPRARAGFAWDLQLKKETDAAERMRREIEEARNRLEEHAREIEQRGEHLEDLAEEIATRAEQTRREAEMRALEAEHRAVEAEYEALEAEHDALEEEYDALSEWQDEVVYYPVKQRLNRRDLHEDYTFVISNMGNGQGSERDRRLLSFKKSDLKKELSYDEIKGKVEQIDY